MEIMEIMEIMDRMDRMDFGEKLFALVSLYSDDSIPPIHRIRVFRALIDHIKSESTLAPLLQELKESLKEYYRALVLQNDVRHLKLFEDTFPETDFQKQTHRHLYADVHNVHSIVSPTVQTGLRLIEKYQSTYVRPFDHRFFSVIEEADMYQEVISLTSLFASITLLIESQPQEVKEAMLVRLREEMDESDGTCVTGHVSRLINSVRGFTDEFDVVVDTYEISRARVFHQLNKRVDLDDFVGSVVEIANNLDHELTEDVFLRVLKDYTKREWAVSNGLYIIQ